MPSFFLYKTFSFAFLKSSSFTFILLSLRANSPASVHIACKLKNTILSQVELNESLYWIRCKLNGFMPSQFLCFVKFPSAWASHQVSYRVEIQIHTFFLPPDHSVSMSNPPPKKKINKRRFSNPAVRKIIFLKFQSKQLTLTSAPDKSSFAIMYSSILTLSASVIRAV